MLVYFLQLIVVLGVKMEVPALGLGYADAKVDGKGTDVKMVRFQDALPLEIQNKFPQTNVI